MVMLGLCAAALPCVTHFMKLPINSSCADVSSRGSQKFGSERCNRGQTIFMRYTF
uniref:Uncharacterized protein n=2 Tax=Anguilla anguilla TaxID=7936 RepID=A0A0E9V794_ANGAN